MKLNAIIAAAGLALASFVAPASVSAAVVKKHAEIPNYQIDSENLCSAIDDVTPKADACFGSSNSNAQQVDVNADLFNGVEGLFGFTDWYEILAVPTVGGDLKSGTISIPNNTASMVGVLLKSGPQFAAYRFDDGLSGNLSFITANVKGLSNYLVVGRDISAVPVPAAGFLLIGALGGLAALRSRKAA